ncbi:MAG: IS21 family transposase, partial [Candidatus Binatia bacterium]
MALDKGGVEGEVGYFRRHHWVPVPQADSLEQLNQQLLAACRADKARHIAGHCRTVGEEWLTEREHLLPLAEEGFETAAMSFPRVDSMGCAKVRTNFYSVPLAPGTQVEARVYAEWVELWHEGRRVARHERSYSRQQKILDLEHYLEVLAGKPGALAGSTALQQWRRQGRWPASYDRFWAELQQRRGRQDGTREMIEVLRLGPDHGWPRLRAAIEQAMSLGCWDGTPVRYLLLEERLERAEP